MKTRTASAVAAAGVLAATMMWAPAAGAGPNRQTCQDAGNTTTCQTNGSVSIAATPGTKAPPANRPQIPIPWLVYG